MYYSVSDIRENKAAALAVVTAKELGDNLLLGDKSHIAFETTVLHIARLAQQSNLPSVAVGILNLDAEQKTRSLKAGLQELNKIFGGEKAVLNFFSQAYAPKSGLRFDLGAGKEETVLAAKNRAALSAARAIQQRRLMPEEKGYTECERAFIDFTKSIHRSLDRAAHEISASTASEILSEIENATYEGRSKRVVNQISMLQLVATEEYFEESSNKMFAQYAKLLEPDAAKSNDPDPSPH